jgi:hypothetical protein
MRNFAWIYLSQDENLWWDLVRRVMNSELNKGEKSIS